jgi:hypothetical protein
MLFGYLSYFCGCPLPDVTQPTARALKLKLIRNTQAETHKLNQEQNKGALQEIGVSQ